MVNSLRFTDGTGRSTASPYIQATMEAPDIQPCTGHAQYLGLYRFEYRQWLTFVNADACANWLGLGRELPSWIQLLPSTLGKNTEIPADRITGAP